MAPDAHTSKKKKLAPLKITCTSTACDDGLHCFKQARKKGKEHVSGGKCRDCGADLVDFSRVQKRNLKDLKYTFKSLKYELIRHHFWHLEIDLRAVNYARRKGTTALQVAAEKRIRSSVGPAQPWRDGTQTPKSGNPLYYAQHATATCCRKCIQYWHGVETGRDLSEEEIQYFTALVNMFVEDRLPNLTESGEKVPPIKKSDNDSDEEVEE
jgi:Domain of unknown function (DUF4186)